MVELRNYQHEALIALFEYWRSGGGNALIDLPTGTGKSLVIADLVRRLLLRQRRIAIVSHVREIVAQDAAAIQATWPDMPPGTLDINSAALGERDTEAPLLLATIQSIFRNPRALGLRNLLIVDEAHRIPKHEFGMYHTTIAGLRALYPAMRVFGATATPYRLDCGWLDAGKDRLFDRVVYSYSIADAIKDGWLAPLVAKDTDSEIDTTNVGRRGGEFILSELECAADQGGLVEAAADEIVHGAGRRQGWLAFCCGVQHSFHVCDALRARGVNCTTIVGTTANEERERLIAEFRAGRITCLAGCDIFTTGFDIAHVDLIAMLRPTLSPGLYVQMAGRGTRLSPGKKNCLLLDFAGNVMRHGPVDAVTVRAKAARKQAEAPAKVCPQCKSIVAAATRTCPDCGFAWPIEPRAARHAAQAGTLSPLGGGEPLWLPVQHIELCEHLKPDKPASLRIDFYTPPPVSRVSDWLAFQHSQGARWHAAGKWRALGGRDPVPLLAREAVLRRSEIIGVNQIAVRRESGYWRVVALRRQKLGAAS